MSRRATFLKFSGVNFCVTRANVAVEGKTGPLAQHIQAAEASGEDLTHKVRREFLCAQSQLWKYRQEQLKAEFKFFWEGHYGLANLTIVNWVLFTRFLVRIAAFFIAGVMIGRGSVYPFLTPGSLFAQSLDHVNPNDIEPHYYEDPEHHGVKF